MAKAPQKSKDAKAKAASGGGKKSKKKWSKGKSRDKLQNLCLFAKPTFERVMKEVPKYKVLPIMAIYFFVSEIYWGLFLNTGAL